MSEKLQSETPVAAATTCSGRVEISYNEIATTGGCCSGMQSVILGIAAAKGCPIDGIIAPKYHPDYNYRVNHYAEGNMSIEWSPRVGQNAEVHTSATGGAAPMLVEGCHHHPNPTRNG